MLFLFGLLVGSSGENGNGNKSGNGLECLLKVARVLRAWDSGPSSLTDTEVVDLEAGEQRFAMAGLRPDFPGLPGMGGGVTLLGALRLRFKYSFRYTSSGFRV